ncbi:PREDICTED: zinc finger protein 541-like [Tinamus guttatus]|uniref:zinc finger protein 541-like n=1 Tax=Tinamus guttatus TaxID=94827 RepID=UPI00052EBC26|nr:PREDICTED: zinc finger protein 541-like [Tinamus guttatus]
MARSGIRNPGNCGSRRHSRPPKPHVSPHPVVAEEMGKSNSLFPGASQEEPFVFPRINPSRHRDRGLFLGASSGMGQRAGNNPKKHPKNLRKAPALPLDSRDTGMRMRDIFPHLPSANSRECADGESQKKLPLLHRERWERARKREESRNSGSSSALPRKGPKTAGIAPKRGPPLPQALGALCSKSLPDPHSHSGRRRDTMGAEREEKRIRIRGYRPAFPLSGASGREFRGSRRPRLPGADPEGRRIRELFPQPRWIFRLPGRLRMRLEGLPLRRLPLSGAKRPRIGTRFPLFPAHPGVHSRRIPRRAVRSGTRIRLLFRREEAAAAPRSESPGSRSVCARVPGLAERTACGNAGALPAWIFPSFRLCRGIPERWENRPGKPGAGGGCHGQKRGKKAHWLGFPPIVDSKEADAGGGCGSGAARRGKQPPGSPHGSFLDCSLCGKAFGSASSLSKHYLSHSQERKHVCGVCSKAFKRQDHLSGHMLTHQKTKPFACPEQGCGKSYCDQRSLRRHGELQHGLCVPKGDGAAPAPPDPSGSSPGASGDARPCPGVLAVVAPDGSAGLPCFPLFCGMDGAAGSLQSAELATVSPSQVAMASFPSRRDRPRLTIFNRIQGGNIYSFTSAAREESSAAACTKTSGVPTDGGRFESGFLCKSCSQLFYTEKGLESHMCFQGEQWCSPERKEEQQENGNAQKLDAGSNPCGTEARSEAAAPLVIPVSVPVPAPSPPGSSKEAPGCLPKAGERESRDADELRENARQKKRKRQTRPKSLFIPPPPSCEAAGGCFQSNLRSPVFLVDHLLRDLFQSSPYTPPPMLSPIREGSGLYFSTLCSASGDPNQLFSTVLDRMDRDFGFCLVKDNTKISVEPHINIGSRFQAEIPTLQDRSNLESAEQAASLVWKPWGDIATNQETQDRVTELLNMACSSVMPGGGTNLELALHCLHEAQGNVLEALEMLLFGGPRKSESHPLANYRYAGSDIWTPLERQLFQKAFCVHKKDFFLIQKKIQTKNVAQCVEYYYIWKKIIKFDCGRVQVIERKVKKDKNELEKTEEKGGDEPGTKQRGCGTGTPRAWSPSCRLRADPCGPAGAFPCRECERVFAKIKSRNAHMKRHRLQELRWPPKSLRNDTDGAQTFPE